MADEKKQYRNENTIYLSLEHTNHNRLYAQRLIMELTRMGWNVEFGFELVEWDLCECQLTELDKDIQGIIEALALVQCAICGGLFFMHQMCNVKSGLCSDCNRARLGEYSQLLADMQADIDTMESE